MATPTTDLTPFISQTNCLNEDSDRPHTNLALEGGDAVCESDADEQLIVRVQFSSAVKLKHLKLTAPGGETAPTVVKVFINTTDLGFDEAEDLKPTQTLQLTEQQLCGDSVVELEFVKFQYVSDVTLFVAENNGGDTTVLSSLRFFGAPIAQTNMSEFKKQG